MTVRKFACTNAVPMAPGEVPVMNPGLPGHTLVPNGRAPQSIAFLSAVGIERLCSGRDDKHAVGLFDLVLEAHDLRRQVAFVVLVVERQIVDAHDFGVEFAGAELDQRLGQFAVDRFAAVRADDDGDLRKGHG